MARGESGRIVIEVPPALKRELYATLAISGSTLKDWFLRNAEAYCSAGVQGALFADQQPASLGIGVRQEGRITSEADEGRAD